MTPTWRQRALALLVGCLLVAAIEGLLRVSGYAYTHSEIPFRFVGPELEMADLVRDPVLFWRIRPDSPEIAIDRAVGGVNNAAGFRGPLVSIDRPVGALRLAFLGDSCTYGVAVPFEQTYVGRLGATLRRQLGQPVELVNTGCPGYSSYQGRRMLETEVLPLRPDVVTIYFGNWNDFVPAIGGDDEVKGQLRHSPRRIADLLRHASSLRLFMLVSQGLDRIGGLRDPEFGTRAKDEYIEAFYRGDPPEGRRVSPEAFRANLVAMVRLCRANGITPVLISPPLSRKAQEEFPIYATYRYIVDDVAGTEQIPLVPAAEEMDRREDLGESVYLDWVHPNAAGHALIVDLLAPIASRALGDEHGAGAVP